jgi:hypothetical protein
MMTKQHFEEIARVLDANRAPLALVEDFADMLSEQNERFNRVLFIKASTHALVETLDTDLARVLRKRQA